MREFKVGDRVKILPKEKLCLVDNDYIYVTSNMYDVCGCDATIVAVDEEYTDTYTDIKKLYSINIGRESLYWTEDMFEDQFTNYELIRSLDYKKMEDFIFDLLAEEGIFHDIFEEGSFILTRGNIRAWLKKISKGR
jgi:hypothetical protein